MADAAAADDGLVLLGGRGPLLPIDVALAVMQAIGAAAKQHGYTDLRTNNAGEILGRPPARYTGR